MKAVAILLSTYNGSNFLREQLDSILSQQNVDIDIYVRDDGSTDGTKSILAQYEQLHSNIHIEFSKNIGVGNSFMELLYSTPNIFDYYAFADQDDIWESNKIEEAIKLLDNSGTMLYASNQECVDKEGKYLGFRYANDRKVHLSAISILSLNMLAGCTMVFGKKLNELLTDPHMRPSSALLANRMHDVWVAMVASLYDGIAYDARSFIKYRQHENNVVGAYSGGFKQKLRTCTKKLFNESLRNGRSNLAKEIVDKFPDAAAKHPLISICASADEFKGKKKLLENQKELRSYTGEKRFEFFLKIMMGIF